MGVHEYKGVPGLGYLRLPCVHGTVPITDLQPGDLVDFGEHEPPADGRWVERPDATATRIADNTWREPEPEQDAAPDDAEPTEDTPTATNTTSADTEPTGTPKRKTATKTTA
jgi:hypothetical protein